MIVSGVVGVLSAVCFDHQSVLYAHEVEDERSHGMLATEFVSTQPAPAQSGPQPTLRVGHNDPQFAGFS